MEDMHHVSAIGEDDASLQVGTHTPCGMWLLLLLLLLLLGVECLQALLVNGKIIGDLGGFGGPVVSLLKFFAEPRVVLFVMHVDKVSQDCHERKEVAENAMTSTLKPGDVRVMENPLLLRAIEFPSLPSAVVHWQLEVGAFRVHEVHGPVVAQRKVSVHHVE